MGRYRVRSVAPGALVVPGALAGALVAAVPGALVAYAATGLIHSARATLEGWRTVRLPLPAPLPAPSMDMVDLLRLKEHLDLLRAWDGALPLVFIALLGGSLALGAVAGTLTAVLVTLLLNAGSATGGGIVLHLEPEPNG
jgi:hypothetical protein